MASIEELKATVRDANRAAGEGSDTLQSAASDTAEAGILAAHTLHNSHHPEVTKILEGLAEIEREVRLATRRFAAAVEHANAYLTQLG